MTEKKTTPPKKERRAYTAGTLYKNVRHFIDNTENIGSQSEVGDLLGAMEDRIVFEETGYEGS